MPEICNCGAQLLPDSLFCHKCGKPQREIVEPEPNPSVAPVADAPSASIEAQALPQALPLNFHNPAAVRVAGTVALVTTLLSWIPAVDVFLWLAAGFFAVVFYRRLTGAYLNVRAGVRLGWITGVLMFAISTVVFTMTVVPMVANGGIASMFREQFKNATDPNVQQALRMLETSQGVIAVLLMTLVMLFVFITFLSMAGGALGARFAGRPAAPRV
jgi:hypothetical protein